MYDLSLHKETHITNFEERYKEMSEICHNLVKILIKTYK